MNGTCETEYEFTLVLDGIESVSDTQADALFEAGCDDGTVFIQNNRVGIRFSRQATSMRTAIISAITDIKNADIGASVLRVDECDLVTQSDISRRANRTRSCVNNWARGERAKGFPKPACNITDKTPLWYWCEVAEWLYEYGIVSQRTLDEARDIPTINSVLELQRRNAESPAQTLDLINRIGGLAGTSPVGQ